MNKTRDSKIIEFLPARACFVVPDIDVLLRVSISVGSTVVDIAIGGARFKVPGIFIVNRSSGLCEVGISGSGSEFESSRTSAASSISDDDGWCDFLYNFSRFGLNH